MDKSEQELFLQPILDEAGKRNWGFRWDDVDKDYAYLDIDDTTDNYVIIYQNQIEVILIGKTVLTISLADPNAYEQAIQFLEEMRNSKKESRT